MSSIRITYIYCDHPDCADGEPLMVSPRPVHTATEQRAWGRKCCGWTYKKRRDLCSTHSTPSTTNRCICVPPGHFHDCPVHGDCPK